MMFLEGRERVHWGQMSEKSTLLNNVLTIILHFFYNSNTIATALETKNGTLYAILCTMAYQLSEKN